MCVCVSWSHNSKCPFGLMTREGECQLQLALCKTLLCPCSSLASYDAGGGRSTTRHATRQKRYTSRKDEPEGEVPSLQQNFSILLPHFQQHVKQLGHGEAIALRSEQNVVTEERSREEIRCFVNTSSLHMSGYFLAVHRTFIIFPNSSHPTHPHPLLQPCLYPHPAHPTSITLVYTEAHKWKKAELLQIDQGYAKGWA